MAVISGVAPDGTGLSVRPVRCEEERKQTVAHILPLEAPNRKGVRDPRVWVGPLTLVRPGTEILSL